MAGSILTPEERQNFSALGIDFTTLDVFDIPHILRGTHPNLVSDAEIVAVDQALYGDEKIRALRQLLDNVDIEIIMRYGIEFGAIIMGLFKTEYQRWARMIGIMIPKRSLPPKSFDRIVYELEVKGWKYSAELLSTIDANRALTHEQAAGMNWPLEEMRLLAINAINLNLNKVGIPETLICNPDIVAAMAASNPIRAFLIARTCHVEVPGISNFIRFYKHTVWDVMRRNKSFIDSSQRNNWPKLLTDVLAIDATDIQIEESSGAYNAYQFIHTILYNAPEVDVLDGFVTDKTEAAQLGDDHVWEAYNEDRGILEMVDNIALIWKFPEAFEQGGTDLVAQMLALRIYKLMALFGNDTKRTYDEIAFLLGRTISAFVDWDGWGRQPNEQIDGRMIEIVEMYLGSTRKSFDHQVNGAFFPDGDRRATLIGYQVMARLHRNMVDFRLEDVFMESLRRAMKMRIGPIPYVERNLNIVEVSTTDSIARYHLILWAMHETLFNRNSAFEQAIVDQANVERAIAAITDQTIVAQMIEKQDNNINHVVTEYAIQFNSLMQQVYPTTVRERHRAAGRFSIEGDFDRRDIPGTTTEYGALISSHYFIEHKFQNGQLLLTLQEFLAVRNSYHGLLAFYGVFESDFLIPSSAAGIGRDDDYAADASTTLKKELDKIWYL